MSDTQLPTSGANPQHPTPSDNDLHASYVDLHEPSSDFENRDAYLNHELQIMQPKRWRPNLPFRDYRFEYEDTIPAMAATIGKVVMVGAIAATFAGPLGLSDAFVLEKCTLRAFDCFIFCDFIFRVFTTDCQPCWYSWSAYPTHSYCCCCRGSPHGIWFAHWRFWFAAGNQ